MFPVFYKCSFFTIYTYGVFVALAFVVSTFLLARQAKAEGRNVNLIYDLSILLLFAGIISARLLYVVLNWGDFRVNLIEIIMLQHGGLVWFGGLAGAVVAGALFMMVKKMPLLATLDLFSPYVMLGQSIGRIGCFFNGCCYGASQFFPSQLVDSLTLFICFAVLKAHKPKRDGEVFSYYLMLASVQRFLMEYLRIDVRPFYFNLSIFQWMSLAIFICGFLFYRIFVCKKKSY